MNRRKLIVLATVAAGVVWLASGAGGQEAASRPGFTNVASQCGAQAVIDQRLQESAKWMLFGLELVDLDGDGHLDLFAGSHGHGGGVAALNDGKGHFIRAKGNIPDSEIYLYYDIDEDGRTDLGMCDGDGGFRWWHNNSKPGQLDFAKTDLTGGGQCRGNALIDIDRDGKLDWIGACPPGLRFFLGDGKGGFADSKNPLAIPGTNTQGESCITAVDLDGDGRVELLLEWGHYSDGKGNIRLFKQDDKGAWQEQAEAAGLPAKGISIKCVGDFNQDGAVDLLAQTTDKKLVIYFNDGKGRFARDDDAVSARIRPTYLSWGQGVMTDFDNDGVSDILTCGRYYLQILRGTRDPASPHGVHFDSVNKEWGIANVGDGDSGLAYGDLDEDGRLDIVGFERTGESPRVAVYHNDLPKANWVRVRPVGKPGNRGAAGAKIRLYQPGGLGDPKKLLWYEPICLYGRQQNQSFPGLAATERHFGLGQGDKVDVSVEFYPSGKKVEAKAVPANRILTVEEETGKTADRELGK